MQQHLGFIFPGQGSQKEGMLAELAEKHALIGETFQEASTVLGYDLWQLCQQDPDKQLSLTHITQPAILTASVALWRLWCSLGGAKPALMAGHSLGEYSALVCSGALKFTDAVNLVRQRGEFMQSAVPLGVGTMAAIVGLEDEQVKAACAEAARGQAVEAVNFNSPGQVVIAGHVEAVERAIDACKARGAKRALPLPVSAPFHSSLMQPAAERFADVIADIEISVPDIPVIQNFDLSVAGENTGQIRDNLIKQIYSPVPWVDTINSFSRQGISVVVECGPGKVLSGLNKRIAAEMQAEATENETALQAALAAVQS